MSFGSDLRQILNVCHIKMTSLANCLGYDVSYVSKWISGTKFPSEGNIEQICGSIAKYSCDNASDKELRALQGLIGVPHGVTAEGTVRPLTDYLLSSYKRDRADSDDARGFALNPAERFDAAQDKSLDGCLERFLRYILSETSADELEMVISAHSFLRSASFLGEILKDFPGRRLKIHVFYDPADFSSSADYCRFILKACLHIPAVEVDISEANIFRHDCADLLCIVRGCAMLVKAFGVRGSSFPAYSSDLKDVNFQYDAIMSLLRGHSFDTCGYGDTQYERYLFNFFAPNSGAPIGVLKNEMLIPNKDCVSDNEFRSYLIKQGRDLGRLKRYVMLAGSGDEPIYELYYESVIIDFCLNGRGRLSPDNYEPVIISPETRRVLLNRLIHSIEEGNTSTCVLTDVNPVLNCRDSNVTIAYNGALVCAIPANSGKITYLNTPFAVDSFKSVFRDIIALPGDYLLRGGKAIEFLRYAMSFIP